MWIVRHCIPDCVHHVIARFIDRDFLIADDTARERYLQLLGRAMTESDWRCLAFALMSNHVHLAMLAGVTPAERWLRRVHPPFAAWTNERLGRIGPLFAGSSAIWVVRPENERRLVAYIHNNPVRAGVVAHARDSTWTSHRAYLREATVPWLDTEAGLERLRLTSSELDAFVDQDVGYRPEQGALDGIHRAARKRGALEIGTPIAERTVAQLVARPFAHIRPDPRRVLEVCGEVLGVSHERLRSRDRDPALVAARAVAIQSGRAVGLPIAAVASALGITAQHGSRLGLRRLSEIEHTAALVIRARVEAELEEMFRAARAGA
jgi:hypothetical protein